MAGQDGQVLGMPTRVSGSGGISGGLVPFQYPAGDPNLGWHIGRRNDSIGTLARHALMSNSFGISTTAVAAGWLLPAFGPFAKTKNGFKPRAGCAATNHATATEQAHSAKTV